MMRWYVAQVYAGFEEAVKKDLLGRIQGSDLQDYFGDVLVPSAKAKKLLGAADEDGDEQLFPGYVLIEMVVKQETLRFVLSSLRVLRFLGGKEPAPLSKREVDRVLAQVKGEVVVAPKKSEFVVGNEVDISDGPFGGFVGIIEKISEESEQLTVMVSIFGRMTPVVLGFDQVKR